MPGIMCGESSSQRASLPARDASIEEKSLMAGGRRRSRASERIEVRRSGGVGGQKELATDMADGPGSADWSRSRRARSRAGKRA